MKKVLTVILAVVALLACNNEHTPNGVQYPIVFGTSDTRAVADLSTLQDEGFTVYTYFTGFPNDPQGRYGTFEKDVTYNSNQNLWAYEGLEYWIPGVSYWFTAFYPSDLSGLVVNNTSKDQIYSISGFDITSQQDVMVAKKATSVAAGATAPTEGSIVSLNFQHLLANVTIKIKSQIEGVIVKNITLSNIYDNASYNGTVWERPSNTTSVTYQSGVTLTKNEDYKDVTGGGIIVIPGDNEGRNLRIEANKVYNITIPPCTWEQGNRYTYTLLIKQDDIIFEDAAPYVEDWDSESATGSVIIK